MNEKLIFWLVVVWMVGMLVLGVLAVKEVWKDAIAEGNEEENKPDATESEKPSESQSDSKKVE